MSNLRYPSGKTGTLDGSINLASGVFRAGLWRGASYVPTHRVVADVTAAGGVLVATSDPLVLVITDTGAVDLPTPALFPSVVRGGDAMPTIIIWQASGPGGGADLAPAAQRLWLHINRGVGLPVPAAGKPVRLRVPRTALGLIQT